MAWVHASDEENCLALTEGYVPPLEDLHAVYPRTPRYKRVADREPEDPEEAVAWILTAYTQELIPYAVPGMPSRVPVETWLLAPP